MNKSKIIIDMPHEFNDLWAVVTSNLNGTYYEQRTSAVVSVLLSNIPPAMCNSLIQTRKNHMEYWDDGIGEEILQNLMLREIGMTMDIIMMKVWMQLNDLMVLNSSNNLQLFNYGPKTLILEEKANAVKEEIHI